MSDERDTLPDQLRQKFPNLRPAKGVPSLFTLNGIGLSMYGRRDTDDETQTYVKTRCFCFVFAPLLALDAYRVADAGQGRWAIIGREPLSHFARNWNIAVACLVVWGCLFLGWNIHTSSPEYRARQELRQAGELARGGQLLRAAGIYKQQVNGPLATEAHQGLKDSLTRCLDANEVTTVVGAFNLLNSMPKATSGNEPLVGDAFNRGLALVEKFRPQNPDGALDILNQAARLDTNAATVAPLRVSLLKEIIHSQPDKTNRLVELALLYEADKQDADCIQLLMPYGARLGDTEGARILGQHLLREGQNEDSYKLLFPYVQTRLGKVREVEAIYTNTLASISRRAVDDLRQGRGTKSFYDAYDAASETKKADLVDDYIQQRMLHDPSYQRMLVRLKEANQIVPVALDLGIVQLNRAQDLKDASARKAELEAAEKTFLAIRGFAGESDEYRLFLGQVYYWLGKSGEGKELFDQLLASRKRAYPILMSIGNTMRDVGESTAARALAEEAYQSASENKQKYAAAMFRALAFKDNADRIAWLAKGNPEDSYTQIELNYARSVQSLQQGNKKLAADQARAAIVGYEKMTRNAATLNNSGLAYFILYDATGNPEDQKHGLALIEEAITLNPSDSILLINVAHSLVSQAVTDLLRDHVHAAVLGEQPGIDSLSFTYLNADERAQVFQRLRDNESFRKGLAYLDKALTLAPKNVGLYGTALSIHGGYHDVAELQKLEQRFLTATPDLDEIHARTLENYAGTKDKENLERLQGRIRTLEGFLDSPAIRDSARTLDFLNVSLIGNQQNAWVYGGTVDSGKMLQTALATYQRHKSAATRGSLLTVYEFRASEELARQNPEYAALVQRTRKVISPASLLTLVIERSGPLADLALKNDSLKKAVALQKEILAGSPTRTDVGDWALLRRTDPAAAAEAARHIKTNSAVGLINQLQFQMNPSSGNAILDQFWTKKLAGDEKGANEVYRAALNGGVPLPPL